MFKLYDEVGVHEERITGRLGDKTARLRDHLMWHCKQR